MAKKLYVGNLDFGVDDETLQEWFAAHGTVESTNLIKDRRTGRSKGYGFVEMSSESEAQAAIAALNDSEQDGRTIKVAEALPPRNRDGGGFRGGRGGGRDRDRW